MKHILISRVDNIGDVVLTLPLAGVLKQQFDVKITLLARDYVRAIAENCEHIDAFESWDNLSSLPKKEAILKIQSWHIDAVIHAFPKKEIATLMYQARVPLRIGTGRRIYHWLTCNKKIYFSRAKSDLHEAQLNLKLLSGFAECERDLNELAHFVGLNVDKALPIVFSEKIKTDRFNLIIHPFTNGNTREWPVFNFVKLIQSLPADSIQVFITGSQKEREKIEKEMMPYCSQAINLSGSCDLNLLLKFIVNCDGLIANSTGPLHLAAVLGIHTLGLFPATKGMDVNRWKPLGNKTEVLIADPHCQNKICVNKRDCICMQSISVDQVRERVMKWVGAANFVPRS